MSTSKRSLSEIKLLPAKPDLNETDLTYGELTEYFANQWDMGYKFKKIPNLDDDIIIKILNYLAVYN